LAIISPLKPTISLEVEWRIELARSPNLPVRGGWNQIYCVLRERAQVGNRTDQKATTQCSRKL